MLPRATGRRMAAQNALFCVSDQTEKGTVKAFEKQTSSLSSTMHKCRAGQSRKKSKDLVHLTGQEYYAAARSVAVKISKEAGQGRVPGKLLDCYLDTLDRTEKLVGLQGRFQNDADELSSTDEEDVKVTNVAGTQDSGGGDDEHDSWSDSVSIEGDGDDAAAAEIMTTVPDLHLLLSSSNRSTPRDKKLSTKNTTPGTSQPRTANCEQRVPNPWQRPSNGKQAGAVHSKVPVQLNEELHWTERRVQRDHDRRYDK